MMAEVPEQLMMAEVPEQLMMAEPSSHPLA
jgi:hypothetical protein